MLARFAAQLAIGINYKSPRRSRVPRSGRARKAGVVASVCRVRVFEKSQRLAKISVS
jgi:hypothetical protein